ncbi:hypothetical protein EST38_g14681, partial [Candolleomyces aberdarensis]
MYSEDEVNLISAKMDEACNKNLFQGFKCCLIGASCTKSLIVTVPVHPGYEDNTRNFDLYVGKYIDPIPDRNVRLEWLETAGVCLRSYPRGVRRKERWFWTIFLPYEEKFTGVVEPKNKLYDSFQAGDGRNSVKGNIMVVKSDNRGLVCDVQERDIGHIEWLVY